VATQLAQSLSVVKLIIADSTITSLGSKSNQLTLFGGDAHFEM
jgi:hypothetical protein